MIESPFKKPHQDPCSFDAKVCEAWETQQPSVEKKRKPDMQSNKDGCKVSVFHSARQLLDEKTCLEELVSILCKQPICKFGDKAEGTLKNLKCWLVLLLQKLENIFPRRKDLNLENYYICFWEATSEGDNWKKTPFSRWRLYSGDLLLKNDLNILAALLDENAPRTQELTVSVEKSLRKKFSKNKLSTTKFSPRTIEGVYCLSI